MAQDYFNRAQLHKDFRSWLSAPRAKAQGELKAVSDFESQRNGLVQSNEIEIVLPFMSLPSKRNLAVSPGSAGGYVVGVEVRDFEAFIRAQLVLGRCGVQIWENLSANQTMPRQTTPNTISWLGESEAATTSDTVLGQVGLTPKRAVISSGITKQLERQAPQSFQLYLDSIAEDFVHEIERVALQGIGNRQPLGLFNSTAAGVQTVTLSSATTVANLENFESNLVTKNVEPSRIAWLIDANTLIKWRTVARTTNASKYLVDEGAFFSGSLSILGYQAYVTTNMPSASAAAADWSHMCLGFFGSGDSPPVTFVKDVFSQKRSEVVEITGTMYADVMLRTPNVFCVSSGATNQ